MVRIPKYAFYKNRVFSRSLGGMIKTSEGELYLLTLGSGLMKRGGAATTTQNIAYKTLDSHINRNYPNPFTTETTLEYEVVMAEKVTLKLFTILRAEVATLVNENKQVGKHSVTINAQNHALKAGMYFVKFSTAGSSNTHKNYF